MSATKSIKCTFRRCIAGADPGFLSRGGGRIRPRRRRRRGRARACFEEPIFCLEIMHFGALLTWTYLPLLKRIRSFFSHAPQWCFLIGNGSAAGHSDFICGSARTVLLYASINQPELPKNICRHTCYCPFVAVTLFSVILYTVSPKNTSLAYIFDDNLKKY